MAECIHHNHRQGEKDREDLHRLRRELLTKFLFATLDIGTSTASGGRTRSHIMAGGMERVLEAFGRSAVLNLPAATQE